MKMSNCLFIFAIATLLISCKPENKAENTKKMRSVSCLVVQETEITPQLEARGLSHPHKTSRLAFRISGVVDEISTQKGQRVEENEVLATLEKTDFVLQLEKSQQLLQLSERKLERIKAKERTEVFNIAQAKVKLMENSYKNKLKTYESQVRLNQSNIVSDIDIDRLKTDSQVAMEQLEIARQELVILEKGARIEDIRLAAEEVSLAKVENNIHKQNLKYTELKAPFRGVITSVNIEKGEFFNVNLNPVSVVLDDLYKIKLKVSIPETEIGLVEIGQEAKVFFDSLSSREFKGTVTHIPHKADQISKTFLTEIIVDNTDLSIKVGMFAYARIITGKKKQTVLIPPELLLHDHLGTYVFKLETPPNEKQHAKVLRQNVKPGLLIGNKIQVLDGISQGDWIVDDGNHYIHHQSEVYVVNHITQN